MFRIKSCRIPAGGDIFLLDTGETYLELLAEGVARSTCLKLARHACELAAGTVVVARLYPVTRQEAIDGVRREASLFRTR